VLDNSDPRRECRAQPQTFRPVVDRRRCEGKSDCVTVCPYDVFEVRRIDETEYRSLPILARLKVWAHGKKTAYTPRADACLACGLCVTACPERAITLARVGSVGDDR
jgi:NAD-dependent dihydropyrimidine dehydrogenase PreA subunit